MGDYKEGLSRDPDYLAGEIVKLRKEIDRQNGYIVRLEDKLEEEKAVAYTMGLTLAAEEALRLWIQDEVSDLKNLLYPITLTALVEMSVGDQLRLIELVTEHLPHLTQVRIYDIALTGHAFDEVECG